MVGLVTFRLHYRDGRRWKKREMTIHEKHIQCRKVPNILFTALSDIVINDSDREKYRDRAFGLKYNGNVFHFLAQDNEQRNQILMLEIMTRYPSNVTNQSHWRTILSETNSLILTIDHKQENDFILETGSMRIEDMVSSELDTVDCSDSFHVQYRDGDKWTNTTITIHENHIQCPMTPNIPFSALNQILIKNKRSFGWKYKGNLLNFMAKNKEQRNQILLFGILARFPSSNTNRAHWKTIQLATMMTKNVILKVDHEQKPELLPRFTALEEELAISENNHAVPEEFERHVVERHAKRNTPIERNQSAMLTVVHQTKAESETIPNVKEESTRLQQLQHDLMRKEEELKERESDIKQKINEHERWMEAVQRINENGQHQLERNKMDLKEERERLKTESQKLENVRLEFKNKIDSESQELQNEKKRIQYQRAELNLERIRLDEERMDMEQQKEDIDQKLKSLIMEQRNGVETEQRQRLEQIQSNLQRERNELHREKEKFNTNKSNMQTVRKQITNMAAKLKSQQEEVRSAVAELHRNSDRAMMKLQRFKVIRNQKNLIDLYRRTHFGVGCWDNVFLKEPSSCGEHALAEGKVTALTNN